MLNPQRGKVAIIALIAISLIQSSTTFDTFAQESQEQLNVSLIVTDNSGKETSNFLGKSDKIEVIVTNTFKTDQLFKIVTEIRDSKGVTVFLKIHDAKIGAYGKGAWKDSWTVYWNPSKSGQYLVRTFLLSDLDNPLILTPVKSITVESLKATKSVSLESLKQYALEKINKDRADFGLPPVLLSSNIAAQLHADDLLKERTISHWMTNGEKPYMTYSRTGGRGAVNQNVAVEGYGKLDVDACRDGRYICNEIELFRAIHTAEYDMVYNDKDCCNNGHRDNILDKYHTHVSIGIAYDEYFFVMVQNFENNYIDSEGPTIGTSVREWTDEGLPVSEVASIDIRGAILQNHKLYSVLVYYDPLPTPAEYEKFKDAIEYTNGELVDVIFEPIQDVGYYYEPVTVTTCPPTIVTKVPIQTAYGTIYSETRTVPVCTAKSLNPIEAQVWFQDNNEIRVNFDYSFTKDGVYTFIVMLEDEYAELYEAANYALEIVN